MKKIIFVTFLAIISSTPIYADDGRGGGGGQSGGGYSGGQYRGGQSGGGYYGGGHHGGGYYRGYGGRYYGSYGGYPGWWWLGAGGIWYFSAGPYYPYPYAYPYALQAPPVVVAPQTNIPAQPPGQFWYYCDAAKGYYPYVPSCSGGWQTIPATPPDASTSAPPSAPVQR
jgi:hypothetical protein